MSSAKTMKLEMNAEFPYEEESPHAGLGSTRTVGWAVKGTPFRVLLKVVSKSKVSLAHAQVHLQLLTEETYAPIEIGERPVTWEHSASGSVIACEVRLQVLSTQLAKSCVIIKATIIADGQKLEAMSCPIKVVSKPEQIRKKRKEANQDPELEGSKKRARSEDVLVELRSLHSSLIPAVDALRQHHKMSSHLSSLDEASMDLSEVEDDFAEDYETATNVTTDDDRTTGEEGVSFCDSIDEDPTASQRSSHASSSKTNNTSLISTFELMLQSFEAAHNEAPESLSSDASLDRLRATFNFLGLPSVNQTTMMDSEDYH